MTSQKENLFSFLAGLVFALGLGISGMTRPDVVIGFLDVTGEWNPSLLFVMGGAAGINFLLFHWILKRPGPLFGTRFHLPTRADIDARLILGAAIFGVGWGLGGICPGPGLVSSVSFAVPVVVFVVAMLVGMYLFRLYDQATQRR